MKEELAKSKEFMEVTDKALRKADEEKNKHMSERDSYLTIIKTK